MDEIEVGRIILLWLWCFGLACIEMEIEGGYGWAQRLPTWWLGSGLVGEDLRGWWMGHRPLTGYHVFAFTIPFLILHVPYVIGSRLDARGGAGGRSGTFFALAVFWDYMWFVFNPAYTVARFKRGQRLVVRGPLDLALPARLLQRVGLSVGLAALAALADGQATHYCTSSGCWPGSRC